MGLFLHPLYRSPLIASFLFFSPPLFVEKKCILTITRPNGATRSYTTKPEFSCRAEARVASAAVAVKMGAIDFIKQAPPRPLRNVDWCSLPFGLPWMRNIHRGLTRPARHSTQYFSISFTVGSSSALFGDVSTEPGTSRGASLPFLPLLPPPMLSAFHGSSCLRWTRVKTIPDYGCALQVKLLMYLFRVFTVDVVHLTFEAAKAMCAADAISEGILDFIKFGNGQTAPAERRLFQDDDTMSAPPPGALTLQGFFEALPRPLPEPRRRQDGGRDQRARLAERPLTVCAWRKVRAQVHLDD